VEKHSLILIAILATSCSNQESSPAIDSSAKTKPVKRDCLRIVRSELYNLHEGSPIFLRALNLCTKGAAHYTDEHAACIQQSPYTNALDCAYKARGMDRSKRSPALKEVKVGQYGHFDGTIRELLPSIYKDADPKRSIDSAALQSYLERRDKLREIAHLPKIEDKKIPLNVTQESFEEDGVKYWVVRQTYEELQLAKIMRETQTGAESVFCAQYGSIDNKLRLNDGLCSGLLSEHFNVTSPGA